MLATPAAVYAAWVASLVVPEVVRVVVPEVVRTVAGRQQRPSPDLAVCAARLLTSTPVEQPCYKCQAAVEEGVPFCPHCAAPLIRVVPPERSEPASLPEQPPAVLPQSTSPWGPPRSSSRPSEPIYWNQALQGAVLAGIGAALLSSIPFLAVGSLIWVTIAGAVAVSMYQRRVPAAIVRPGMGLRIGAVAGVVASAVIFILGIIRYSAERDQVRQLLQEQMQTQIAKTPDPANREALQQLMGKLMTPEGVAAFFVFALLMAAAACVLLSAVGGALGASLSARRRGLS